MDIKDAIVGGALTVAVSMGGWAHKEIFELSNKVTVLEGKNTTLENEISYMNRTIEAFIRKDVYEVDKLYMFERMKNK